MPFFHIFLVIWRRAFWHSLRRAWGGLFFKISSCPIVIIVTRLLEYTSYIVHINSIYKAWTNFYVPYILVYTLTGKPNSTHDSADGDEDGKNLLLSTNTLTLLFIFLELSRLEWIFQFVVFRHIYCIFSIRLLVFKGFFIGPLLVSYIITPVHLFGSPPMNMSVTVH